MIMLKSTNIKLISPQKPMSSTLDNALAAKSPVPFKGIVSLYTESIEKKLSHNVSILATSSFLPSRNFIH